MKNPWQDLPKPLIVQAPMEEVTDTVFRQMLAKYGRPSIFFTEFTNVDGVFSAGKQRVIQRLRYNPEIERPIIAQIWGHSPENYYQGAQYVRELGFDGIDINMGCPQRKIVSKGLCGALINNPDHAEKIIRATLDGARGLPVSVKTRIGVKDIETERWIGFLLGFPLAAITVHGRTVEEKSKVPCHWDEIGKAVRLRDKLSRSTVIIGNGDVQSYDEACAKVAEHGVDGVMIARALMDDVQACSPTRTQWDRHSRLKALREHVELFQQTWGEGVKPDQVLKKYVNMYIRDFDGAKELRMKLVSGDHINSLLQEEMDALSIE